LTVQRELWKDTRLEVGYVGNRTRDWVSKYDINAIVPADRVAYIQQGNNNNLRPYNAIQGGGIPFFDHHGNAQYDSIQAAFNSQLTHNSFVGANYTFGRSFSDEPLNVVNGGGGLIPDP